MATLDVEGARRRSFILNQMLVFGIIFGLCLTWVLMSEFIQGMQEGWEKPWFILYVIHSGYAFNLLIYWALYGARTGDWMLRSQCSALVRCFRRGSEWREESPVGAYLVPTKQLIILSLVLALLSAFVGYSWYISLNHTLASANNAIYQSAAAVVFLLSWVRKGCDSVCLSKSKMHLTI